MTPHNLATACGAVFAAGVLLVWMILAMWRR